LRKTCRANAVAGLLFLSDIVATFPKPCIASQSSIHLAKLRFSVARVK
jgi:hypothetical protein